MFSLHATGSPVRPERRFYPGLASGSLCCVSSGNGALANRKRGSVLPKVYEALEMTPRKKPEKPGFAVLMKGFLGTDPYQCILCKGRLRFAGAQAGCRRWNYCRKGCVEWRKSDGCGCLSRISVP
ncbi:hypothetical protein EWM60_01950 [Candidatus Erwinia dacicola]|nr:hypothetical protein [Candidatus Erwinia dacicola]